MLQTKVNANDFAAGFAPGGRLVLNARGDIERRIVNILQSLESNISFASRGNVRRIRWHELEPKRIPESEEEHRLIAIPGVSFQDWYAPTGRLLSREELVSLIEKSMNPDDLIGVKAFWREAMNEMIQLRFIQSFFASYFVLEGLFANGKSAEREVLREFGKSSLLHDLTEEIAPHHWDDISYGPQLRALYQSLKCGLDVAGTHKLLVRMRGSLHHYRRNSSKPQPVPFEQSKYESLANLSLALAMHSLDILDSGNV